MKYLLDVALDASEAAVDIFNRDDNSFAIKRVINFLYGYLEKGEINLTKDVILAEATMWPDINDLKRKSRENIKLQTKLFLKDLESLDNLPYEKRETLMNACVDLSKSAVKQFEELRSYLVA